MRSHHPVWFLTKKEKQKILEAIRQAETKTSGEIRVHLIKGSGKPILDHAKELFEKLGMTKTKLRNGVLILLAVKNKQFAILGDQSIHEKVPEDFWNETAHIMAGHFKHNRFAEGITEAVLSAGEKLKTYFPRETGDRNELYDEISYSR